MMNELVYARLVQLHADASVELAEFTSRHRGDINARPMRDELQDQLKSWHRVLVLAMTHEMDSDFDERSVPGA